MIHLFRRKGRATLLVAPVLAAVITTTAFSQQVVTPDVASQALPTAVPGDVLVIANGTYADQVLEWRGKGSAERPVIVRAETPGGVVFTGQSALRVAGEHVVVEGLLFTAGHTPGSEAVSISGSHCTLRHCVIDSYNPPPDDADREEKWVALRGEHHRVEYCTFYNKTSNSVTLTVWRETGKADHHVIVGNHFHTRPKGPRSNGYETIRIGTSDDASGDSATVIEGNLFQACDGEMEIISVKSGANIVRGNSFVECAGTITLRHGSGNLVSGNIIAGKQKKETGGIRVYGSGHRIVDNAIIGTTGRADGAIALLCGSANPPANGYQPVSQVVVQNNLIVANQGAALALAAEFAPDTRPVLPQEVLVDANTLSSDNQATLVSGLDQPGLGVSWTRNQIFLNNQVPRQFTQNRPSLLTPEQVGAVWYRGRLR